MKVYIDKLEEKSKELVNYSKKDIYSVIEELKEMPAKFVWSGIANEKYVSIYNEKINKLIELNNGVCEMAEFLPKVIETYQYANKIINDIYQELLSLLSEKNIDIAEHINEKNVVEFVKTYITNLPSEMKPIISSILTNISSIIYQLKTLPLSDDYSGKKIKRMINSICNGLQNNKSKIVSLLNSINNNIIQQ